MAQVQLQGAEPDHPPLSDVIERNIQNQVRLRIEAVSRRTFQERMADAITAFSGSMSFVYLHVLWFGLWVLLNTGWFGIPAFDPFPYSLLTMIVSLEAIFLSTFVLISQNRSSAEADRRADVALHVGLLTEHEVTRALQMLDAIQERNGNQARRCPRRDPASAPARPSAPAVRSENAMNLITTYLLFILMPMALGFVVNFVALLLLVNVDLLLPALSRGGRR